MDKNNSIIGSMSDLEEILRELDCWEIEDAPAAPSRSPAPSSLGNPKFGIDDHSECWRISGVAHHGNVYTVDLAKTLLDGGAGKTQDGWVPYSLAARQNGQFHVGSAPLYHALFTALYENKGVLQHGVQIEKVRVFLKSVFDVTWVHTLSRVAYQSSGQDVVTHNLGMPDAYTIDGSVVGPDGWLRSVAGGSTACKAVLGSANHKKIDDVYKWISGEDTYLWRMNSKPSIVVERAVVLGVVGIGRFVLYANDLVDVNWPALGVRVGAKNSKTGKR